MKSECKIIEHINTLRERRTMTVELNLVRWDNMPAQYDIRRQSDKREPWTGVALTPDEAKALYFALKAEFEGH